MGYRIAPGYETTGLCECEALRQQVQTLTAENERLRKQNEWQPIETAPKDGTDILLYTTDWGVIQGWFAAGQWSEHPEYGREYSGDVWVCADDALNIEIETFPDGTYHHGNATHWMPLPTPPSARDGIMSERSHPMTNPSDDSGTMSKRAIQHKASRQDKAYKLEQWRLAGARIAAAAAISGRGTGQEPRKSED